MARSYTEELAVYQRLSLSTSTNNTTLFNTNYNDAVRMRLGGFDWKFLEKERTGTTVPASRTVHYPVDAEKLRGLRVLSGSTVYTPRNIVNEADWQRLVTTSYSSDIPTAMRSFATYAELTPIPINANTVTFNYKKKVIDINVADYTTGTVAITTGTNAVVGTTTTFTSAMVGRSIKTTDGFWYEISAVADSTHLTLFKNYIGTTVSSGTFTIGQMSVFPDGFENIPIYDALSVYYETQKVDLTRAASQKTRADQLFAAMKNEGAGGMVGTSVDDGMTDYIQNPNNFINF